MDRRYRESLYRVVSIGGDNFGWSRKPPSSSIAPFSGPLMFPISVAAPVAVP